MTPYRVPAEAIHFFLDPEITPALRVPPGSTVIFETLDACCGEISSRETFLARRATNPNGNPLSGPVLIEGAEPGHTLLVEILEAIPGRGFQLIGPQRAIITDEVDDWTYYDVECREGQVYLSNGIVVPAQPVIGSFGTAPAGPATNCPIRLGGNMDVPAVGPGAKLYLPVEVPGALFSLGDVHACQGDGEVVGAPEVSATVTARIELLKESFSPWYMIETATHWYTAMTAESEGAAAKAATLHNAEFLMRREGVSVQDALVFLTLQGSLNISRTAWWGQHGPVVCAGFAKEMAHSALCGCRREGT